MVFYIFRSRQSKFVSSDVAVFLTSVLAVAAYVASVADDVGSVVALAVVVVGLSVGCCQSCSALPVIDSCCWLLNRTLNTALFLFFSCFFCPMGQG